jgi:hypothetical protein
MFLIIKKGFKFIKENNLKWFIFGINWNEIFLSSMFFQFLNYQ